jgi:teichuronic acid biosynthesis glycosyltransferase TuaC
VRIAIVTTSYPADRDDGAGSFVRAEALRLRLRGEVHVICPGPFPRPPVEPTGPGAGDAGIEVHAVGGSAAFGWPGAAAKLRAAPWLATEAARFAWEARRTLARLAPSHVQAHWLVPGAFPIAVGCASVEAVAHGGDVRALLALPRPARAAIVAAILSGRSTIRFVSTRGREELLSALPSSVARAVALQSRVEPCALAPLGSRRDRALVRADLGLGDEPVACVVARLVPSKRVALALEAAAAAGVNLVVIGDGPERAALERNAGEGARFVGYLPRSRALDVLAASDLLVDASEAEGAPTAVREARALDVPVISCGAGDVPCWSERDAGITLVAPRQLAGALRGLAFPSNI